METFTIILSLGLLFGSGCEEGCRVLTGKETPTGTFIAKPMSIKAYGFLEDGKGGVFAIHPVWTERRAEILNGPDRRFVSDGCVNVSEETFKLLPERRFKLRIEP